MRVPLLERESVEFVRFEGPGADCFAVFRERHEGSYREFRLTRSACEYRLENLRNSGDADDVTSVVVSTWPKAEAA